MKYMLDSVWTFLKDVLAPKKCYSCKKEWHFLCDECFAKQDNFEWFCYICKRKSLNFKIHKKCLIENKLLSWKNFNDKKIYLDKVVVLTHYRNKVIKKLIIAFKFFGRKSIWRELWARLSILIEKNVNIWWESVNYWDYIIIPVPLHFWRKIMRWFNQSEVISDEIWKMLNIYYSNKVVLRKKSTRHQSKLSQEKRIDNLRDAFKIDTKQLDKIDNKIVLLVDDVVSSGTTLNEIAKILKQNGARRVIGVVLASD